MSLSKDHPLYDLSRTKDHDFRDHAYNEAINSLLDDNNLCRKPLPKGANSLMRAIAEGFSLVSRSPDALLQSLLNHMRTLIATNSLPRRLASFRGNHVLLNDYLSNPLLSGFEKINLEIASSLFKAKVVVYTMTEDNYLAATIINSKFDKTIEFFRTKNNHYDLVYPKEHLKTILCQDIIAEIIDKATEQSKFSPQDNMYPTLEYRGSVDTNYTENYTENSIEQQHRIPQSRHKKSYSDTLNKASYMQDDQDLRPYNMFTTASPPDDFLRKLKVRKDTTESNFSLKANLDFMEDVFGDMSPSAEKAQFAIKNYPIPSSGLSSKGGSIVDLDNPISKIHKSGGLKNQQETMFHENVSLLEIERLERLEQEAVRKSQTRAKTYIQSPPQMQNFNNNGFMPKPFNFNENGLGLVNQNFAPVPGFVGNFGARREEHMQGGPNIFGFGDMNKPVHHMHQHQQQHMPPFVGGHPPIMLQKEHMYQPGSFSNHKQQNKMPNMQGNVNLQIEEYNNLSQPQQRMMPEKEMMYPMSFPGVQGQGQGQAQGQHPHGHGGKESKKKGHQSDDVNRRQTGRLKFFDEAKNYGFIVMDEDGSDIFVHYDDLAKAQVSKDLLKELGRMVRLSFIAMNYYGKYSRSRKAIDIEMI